MSVPKWERREEWAKYLWFPTHLTAYHSEKLGCRPGPCSKKQFQCVVDTPFPAYAFYFLCIAHWFVVVDHTDEYAANIFRLPTWDNGEQSQIVLCSLFNNFFLLIWYITRNYLVCLDPMASLNYYASTNVNYRWYNILRNKMQGFNLSGDAGVLFDGVLLRFQYGIHRCYMFLSQLFQPSLKRFSCSIISSKLNSHL